VDLGERLEAVDGGVDGVALVTQKGGERRAGAGLVVDDEDAAPLRHSGAEKRAPGDEPTQLRARPTRRYGWASRSSLRSESERSVEKLQKTPSRAAWKSTLSLPPAPGVTARSNGTFVMRCVASGTTVPDLLRSSQSRERSVVARAFIALASPDQSAATSATAGSESLMPMRSRPSGNVAETGSWMSLTSTSSARMARFPSSSAWSVIVPPVSASVAVSPLPAPEAVTCAELDDATTNVRGSARYALVVTAAGGVAGAIDTGGAGTGGPAHAVITMKKTADPRPSRAQRMRHRPPLPRCTRNDYLAAIARCVNYEVHLGVPVPHDGRVEETSRVR